MKSAAAVTAAVLFLAAPPSQAIVSSPVCPERALTLRASSTGPDVVRVSVTQHGGRTCTVGRAPTVTFENLDGSALPVPRGTTGRYRLDPGDTAYATVRTIADPADPEARRVDALAVAADPSHWGRAFTAAELGAGDAIRVWEPVTSRWQPSAAAADRALGIW
ncbi:DUF4232 domain-containing protein [Streptomyces sp. NBC_00140]|uniref:DUF4232 domain-containing protein n=1 Tax=Streptomyces sp. NBC_00140 TaxID=2975664 RepID=UPI00224E7C45|nr:DUF4232 domain-containing protein [Streptomyces sp. NBC_00140]MCX5337107.1 DUF4232 domain-containing protein [Streptomyces sp. NBC_00140]